MKKRNLLVALLIFVSFIFTGCQNNNGTGYSETETVKIGVIAPLTDFASAYGMDAVNVFNFSVDKFNKSHDDVNVELVIEDGKCEGGSAVSAIQKLINIDNIDVLLGGWCSAETLAAGPIAQENKLTTLAAGSSSPDIVNIGDYVYRFWNDNISANKLAKYMNGKYQNVAILYSNDAMYVGLHDSFEKKYDGNVLSFKVNIDEKDYAMIVQQLISKINNVDGIVLLGDEEFTIGVIKEMNNSELLSKFKTDIYGAYQFSSKETVETLGADMLEGMKQISVNMDTLGSTEKGRMYMEEFTKVYDVQGADTYVYFDADGIELLLEAIEKGARESEDFKLYFDSITAENPRDGILGNYYFNEDREADGLEDAIELQEIHNGVGVNI